MRCRLGCPPSCATLSCPLLRTIADLCPLPRVMKQLAHHRGELQTPTFTLDATDPAYLTGEMVAATRARALPQVGPARFYVLDANIFPMVTAKFAVGDQIQLHT